MSKFKALSITAGRSGVRCSKPIPGATKHQAHRWNRTGTSKRQSPCKRFQRRQNTFLPEAWLVNDPADIELWEEYSTILEN
ncbi:hypothetical protein RCL_jg14008.t1 [Rhizophagus clarus]|uniref:Uncharacterized protein n=1 Tax=Rhizophagus clarus TaxID=94130 RepID=A0A8H3LV01_9GLOM|nr:hypothetical protein RCL_jg14008.t1 [Rhizophagus clarus]